MKPFFNNLNAALTYHMEGLHDAEKKLQATLPNVVAQADAAALKGLLKSYAASAADKRIKLKRAFSYLLAGPFGKKSKAIGEMIAELSTISAKALAPEIKDAMLAGSLRTIIYFKISAYATAMSFALALEVHPVADLIGQILEWENEADQELTKIMSALSARAAKQTTSAVRP